MKPEPSDYKTIMSLREVMEAETDPMFVEKPVVFRAERNPEMSDSTLKVFALGATPLSETWGPRQVIAAVSEIQARAMVRWDYNDTTEWVHEIDGVRATGNPRVLFEHPGG